MARSDLIVWMDLEMTGLVPSQDHILEMATLITDSDLEIVAEGPELVIHQPEEVLARMNAFSVEHHAASGLTERVRRSTLGPADAEAATLSFVAAHCRPGTAPLAGNSVHLDRYFLLAHMKHLAGYLHPDNVDVSTIKELVSRWYPRRAAKAPPKADAHRALADIEESIAELRYYRQAIFRAP